MIRFVIVAAALALTGCGDVDESGQPVAEKVLTTEEGVTLWSYDPGQGRRVYFTSTSAMQRSGKHGASVNLVTNSPEPEIEPDEVSVTGRVVNSKQNPDGTVTLTIEREMVTE